MQKLRVALLAASTLGAATLFYAANPATADVTAVAGSATPAFIGGTAVAPTVAGSATEATNSFGPIGSGVGLLPSGVSCSGPGAIGGIPTPLVSLGLLEACTRGGGVTGENHLGFAESGARVADVILGTTNLGVITTTCRADGNGAVGTTTIVGSSGLPTNPTPGQQVPLTLGGLVPTTVILTLNEQIVTNVPGTATITVNGVRLNLAGIDIILAQSTCSATGPNVNVPQTSTTLGATTTTAIGGTTTTTLGGTTTTTRASTTTTTAPPVTPTIQAAGGTNNLNINSCNAGAGGNGGSGLGIGGNATSSGGTTGTGGTATGGAGSGPGGAAGNGGDACNLTIAGTTTGTTPGGGGAAGGGGGAGGAGGGAGAGGAGGGGAGGGAGGGGAAGGAGGTGGVGGVGLLARTGASTGPVVMMALMLTVLGMLMFFGSQGLPDQAARLFTSHPMFRPAMAGGSGVPRSSATSRLDGAALDALAHMESRGAVDDDGSRSPAGGRTGWQRRLFTQRPW